MFLIKSLFTILSPLLLFIISCFQKINKGGKSKLLFLFLSATKKPTNQARKTLIDKPLFF
ncbi:hypothetical protein SCODD09_00707 [Streptococcus constellatus]|nr:hypothetical protein SCODD09_00707 [Streptococcus constellatus]